MNWGSKPAASPFGQPAQDEQHKSQEQQDAYSDPMYSSTPIPTFGGFNPATPIALPAAATYDPDTLYLDSYGRAWGEKLTFSVGTAYGAGILTGGALGALEGLRQGGPTMKLRINSILNASGRRGSRLGNSLAGLSLLYCLGNMGLSYMRGTEDIINSVAAGSAAGLIYTLTNPPMPKTMIAASVLGAAFMASAVTGSRYLSEKGYSTLRVV
eukprot:GILK01004994.1.p1 GENE.GILK01004994.1~~GILK01004994.1.p1  ORF type:complete len:212 (-),score=19.87 GILK01004994.1:130-765(-)